MPDVLLAHIRDLALISIGLAGWVAFAVYGGLWLWRKVRS